MTTGRAGIARPALAAAPAVAQNLLANGSFEGGTLAPWTLSADVGAATPSRDTSTSAQGAASAALRVTAAAQDWQIRFEQANLSLAGGQVYTLSFYAKAAAPHSVPVALYSFATGAEYANATVFLTTTWQPYTLSFPMTASDPNVVLSFYVGNAATTTWVDGVSLSAGAATPAAGPTLLANGAFGAATLAPWVGYVDAGAGTFSRDTSTSAGGGSASAAIKVTTAASPEGAIRLEQGGLPLVAGQGYVLSFYAKAAQAHNLRFGLEAGGSSAEYLNVSAPLATTWQRYTMAFTAWQGEADAHLYFGAASAATTTWIASVTLGVAASGAATPTPTPTTAPAATSSPVLTLTGTSIPTSSPAPAATNTPAPTATGTPAPTNTPTATATATPMATATNTPTPTNTPTSTPTATLTAATVPSATSTPAVSATATATATPNAIQVENAQPGTGNWQVTNDQTSGHLIEGYANLTSVNKGGSINFYVNTAPAAAYTLEVYRMGWYQGLGGRLMKTAASLQGITQAPCTMDSVTGMVSCSNWTSSYQLNVPSTWTTGVYIVKLTRADGYQNTMIFVVRDDNSHSTYLYQSGVDTEQAYNAWGGKSLYGAQFGADRYNESKRAYQVSFDRPYEDNSSAGPYDFVSWEIEALHWMERQGYDLSYSTDIDTDLSPGILSQHKAFLSIGHDEYWSKAMRSNIETALASGMNLGFFGANAMYWNIRFNSSALGTNRVITCYKNAQLDPLNNVDNSNVTVRFRDPPLNRPENAVIGQMFSSLLSTTSFGYPFVVANSGHAFYRTVDVTNTSVLPNAVGYEYDQVFNNGSTPPGLTILGQSPLVDAYNHSDFSNATVYTAPSGATVFSSGSMQWADNLDSYVYGAVAGLDSRVQEVTANVMARLGTAPPGTPPPPPAPPTPGPNQVTDGSFEAGAAPWRLQDQNGPTTTEGTFSTDTTTATVGSASGHVHINSGLTSDAPQVQLVQQLAGLTAASGQQYTLRFWAKSSVNRQITMQMDGAYPGTVLEPTSFVFTPRWQNYEFTFQVGETQPTLVFNFGDPSVAGDVWLDGVECVLGQPFTPLIKLGS